jgi:hypothetical protein
VADRDNSNNDREVLAVSPSDLVYLLNECHRCFYVKVRRLERLPSLFISGSYSQIDRLERDFYDGKSTAAISPSLPTGVINCSPERVSSAPYIVSDSPVALRFRGAIDAGLAFDDGSFGVCDFKTIDPKSPHLARYAVQLNVYAWSFENPLLPEKAIAPVDTLGLLCLYPAEMLELPGGSVGFRYDDLWVPIPRSEKLLHTAVRLAALVLSLSSPPKLNPECPRCSIRLQ